MFTIYHFKMFWTQDTLMKNFPYNLCSFCLLAQKPFPVAFFAKNVKRLILYFPPNFWSSSMQNKNVKGHFNGSSVRLVHPSSDYLFHPIQKPSWQTDESQIKSGNMQRYRITSDIGNTSCHIHQYVAILILSNSKSDNIFNHFIQKDCPCSW